MAENFEFVGAQIVPERLSPTEIVDRQRTYFRAIPGNVVFPIDTKIGADLSKATADLTTISDNFNNAALTPGVAGIVINEDTDAGGYIVLSGTTTIVSTSGRSQTEVVSAYSAIGRSAWKTQVADAVTRLDAVEAL